MSQKLTSHILQVIPEKCGLQTHFPEVTLHIGNFEPSVSQLHAAKKKKYILKIINQRI